MLLAALTFAAALTGATPSGSPDAIRPVVGETANIYRAPPGCADIQRQVVERQREELRKLGRLPRASAIYAVERSVGGCPVPTPMGYHPGYLLPGAADTPARGADATSRPR